MALIAIGADIGVPESLASWNAAAVAALRDHGMPKVAVEIRYASWASLGDVIARAARVVPALTRYAEDVLAQLRLDGLLGYQGAPMLDDLDEMNLENAFVAYNRAVVAMRQFFITLHGQDTFHQTGLRALVPHRMARDGTSAALTQHEDWFQVSTFASTYRGPNFPQDVGAYVAFYFHPGDHPEMHVGAFASTALTAFHNNYAWTDESTDVEHACLSALRGADFRNAAGGRELEVVYDTWPWRPGSGDADLQWALSRLRLVVDAFTGR